MERQDGARSRVRYTNRPEACLFDGWQDTRGACAPRRQAAPILVQLVPWVPQRLGRRHGRTLLIARTLHGAPNSRKGVPLLFLHRKDVSSARAISTSSCEPQ